MPLTSNGGADLSNGHRHPPQPSSSGFREFMRGFPSGVAVLATLDEDRQPVGMTCSALCSLSLEPPMLLACVGRWGRMRKAVEHTQSFTVNLLEAPGFQLARTFAAGHEQPFEGIPWRPSHTYHLPVPVEHVRDTAECRLHSSITMCDHTILIGEVVWIAEQTRPTEAPLLHGFSEFGMWRPGLATRDEA